MRLIAKLEITVWHSAISNLAINAHNFAQRQRWLPYALRIASQQCIALLDECNVLLALYTQCIYAAAIFGVVQNCDRVRGNRAYAIKMYYEIRVRIVYKS